MEQTDELSEARRIVAGLGKRVSSLPRDDRRFYNSWAQYLARVGDAAVIGKFRLGLLSRVGALYGLVPPDVAAARYATAQAGTRRVD